MEIKLRRSDNVYIIDVVGEMDLYNAFKLKAIVKKMIEKQIRNYVVNLEQVHYIDSSGIGALLQVHAELKQRGLNLRIAHVAGSVRRVIELTKLTKYLPIADSVTEAVQHLRAVS